MLQISYLIYAVRMDTAGITHDLDQIPMRYRMAPDAV
jgi:hypothetical protein